jgi:EAL domain-containing protein (putative c-di-GMP-specific phosphodiesterase class I)
MKALREIGVDFAQGYWLGKPEVFRPPLKVVASGSGS